MTDSFTFGNVTDTKSIVRFVKDIEKHPCLYDPKLFEYSSRELKRKTWLQIAKNSQTSVAECKEKWRKIRTAYARSLKPRFSKGVRVEPTTPYYLAKYLKFVTLRYEYNHKNVLKKSKMETIPQHNVTEVKIEPNDEELSVEFDKQSDDVDIYEITVKDDSNVDSFDENAIHTVIDSDASIDNNQKECVSHCIHEMKVEDKSFNSKEDLNEVYDNHRKNVRMEDRCNYCVNIERKPRKMFLFSMLPEIEELSDNQMRIFRRDLLDLIDKCKYEVKE